MNANLSDILDVELDESDIDEDYGLDPDTLLRQVKPADQYTLRRRIIERHMGAYTEEQARELRLQSSLEHRLKEAIVDAAWPYAVSINMTVWEFDIDVVEKGVAVVDSFQRGLVKHSSEHGSDAELNFWRHEDDPLSRVRAGEIPYIYRDFIEDAASTYLELPYRVPKLERLLVDVLIAAEVYAFADQMLTPLPMGLRWIPTMAPLKQKHILRQFIGGHFWNAVIFFGIAYVAYNYLPPVIGTTPANWVAAIAIGLFLLLFVIGTITLPFAWYNQSKARAKVRDLISETLLAYAEMGSGGTISARRVREAASKAANKGVIWPGPLFAILDDNISRTGVL